MSEIAGSLNSVSLEDRLDVSKDNVLLNGSQALVRLLLLQREIDRRNGKKTAGYVSGYRGSPLGGLDFALWKAGKTLKAADIVFQPGVNEDLAATAVWGTQQLRQLGPANCDGVFAMWYGKGPGVDRSGDPIKHGNYAGCHPLGGVLAVFGDDHPGKSSTIAHHSEQALAANSVPVLYPSDVGEIVRLGLLGIALSRYSGCWVGLKVVNETAEQTTTVAMGPGTLTVECPAPDDLLPPEGVHYRGVYGPARDEAILLNHRLPLVHRFARANRIDRCTLGGGGSFGIVTAGKAYQDVMQALGYLGIDAARAQQLGLAVYKVGLIWPLEPEGLRTFSQGRRELLFVEEKQAFVESQAAAILYNIPARPRIVGKHDEHGQQLLSQDSQLEPIDVAVAIAARLQANGLADAALNERVKGLRNYRGALVAILSDTSRRLPYFCSGCPHNTSTVVPEGSVALSGIGCHGMASWAKPRTLLGTHMGGEGLNWVGLAQFTKTAHVFQNMGDGTYFHSGLLAIRAAVASKANITYKILFNDAVAMTGGQSVDGALTVCTVANQVLHEGVKRVVVVSDEPEKYDSSFGLPSGIEVASRDDLDRVQRDLRHVEGCTVLIYEQTCAAEKRRRRKKGDLIDPPKRLFINSSVCEGCGDCGQASSCVSVEPKETTLGRKRQINQTSCNKDYSCVKGFCPSFISVRGGRLRKPSLVQIADDLLDTLPEPEVLAIDEGTNHGIMVAGIGGTGVITVSAILAMAAHLEGKIPSVYDMTGLSQKNGAVYSHLRIASVSGDITSARLGLGDASLVLAFDMVAALGDESYRTFDRDKTHFLGNDRVAPMATFVKNPDDRVDTELLKRKVGAKVAENHALFADATGMATALCGDPVAANLMMVGVAAQLGWLPVGVDAIQRAIELNATQVPFNIRAFRIGRLWVHNRSVIESALRQETDTQRPIADQGLDAIVAHRVSQLTAYQNARYAVRYQGLVKRIRQAEQRVAPGSEELAKAVAIYFAKLMAYKDEYEVARLYSAPEFRAELERQFEGDFILSAHLAPPMLSRKDPVTGYLRKREYGSWIFTVMRLLARLKGMRGTPFDVFGYTRERRQERELIDDYESTMLSIAKDLDVHSIKLATTLAQLPEYIRGYGHVKDSNLEKMHLLRKGLLEQWAKRSPTLSYQTA